MTIATGRISVVLTQGGRTHQAWSVDVPDGTYHVSCMVQVGKEPEIAVTQVSRPSLMDRLSRWLHAGT